MKLSGRVRFRTTNTFWFGERVILQVEMIDDMEFKVNQQKFATWRDAKIEDIVELTQLGMFNPNWQGMDK